MEFSSKYHEEAFPDRYANKHGESLARLASGSVTALSFRDGAFDCVISMRLLHHFGDRSVRIRALKELARVAGRFVIVSLWTDGNFKAWRRRRLEHRSGKRAYQNRFVVPRAVLAASG